MVRMVLVSLAVLIFAGLAWLGLRSYGLSKTFDRKPFLLSNEKFLVIAHRGGAAEFPENTLFAFEKAVQIDPNIVLEMDVHLSSDRKFVIIHDPKVDRTTNETGLVKEMTLEKLQSLDAAYNFSVDGKDFPLRGQGIRIPTLEDVLDKLPQTRIILEIKPEEMGLATNLIKLIKSKGAEKRIIFASQHGRAIAEARREDPTLTFSAPKNEVSRSILFLNVGLESIDPMNSDIYAVPEVSDGIEVVSSALVQELHRKQKKIFVWTVNEEEDFQRLKALGVDGVITDRPKFFLQR